MHHEAELFMNWPSFKYGCIRQSVVRYRYSQLIEHMQAMAFDSQEG